MDEEFSSALLTGRVLLVSSCWALPCKTRRAIRPPHADQPAARGEPAAHRLPPTNDPGVHPAYPGRPRGRAGHAQPPPDDDGQVQTDASAGPAAPAPASSARLQRRAEDEPGMDAAGDHARPRPSQPYGCLPHRRAPGPHFGRTQRTRQRTDTGRRHRTPDSGHLDAQTPAPDTGQRSRGQASVDTGRSHRTPDAGRGRGQGDEGAAGIWTSWATTPSDRTLGRPTVFLWTAPGALDSPCRLGGKATFQREIGSRRQLLGRSARVERRLGAVL
jgi:hypothetical protein